jgi:hypothetical protein
MAFHEQHERNCPTCGARISATARKCFNCGEPVDDEDDDDDIDTEGSPRWTKQGSLLRLVAVLVCVGLIVYFVRTRQPKPQPSARDVSSSQKLNQPPARDVSDIQKLHQMIAEMGGHPQLNSSSPVTLAELEPQLRVGMPLAEVFTMVSSKNAGPGTRTFIGNLPLSDNAEGADDTKVPPHGYIIYLKDANLLVVTDEDENVASWESVPIQ